MKKKKLVVIGNGMAGARAVEEVLARGGIAVQVGPSPAPPGCLSIESRPAWLGLSEFSVARETHAIHIPTSRDCCR